MKLTPCDCGTENYTRIQRGWWMRPLASRRLYQCAKCGKKLLIKPELVWRQSGGPGR